MQLIVLIVLIYFWAPFFLKSVFNLVKYYYYCQILEQELILNLNR